MRSGPGIRKKSKVNVDEQGHEDKRTEAGREKPAGIMLFQVLERGHHSGDGIVWNGSAPRYGRGSRRKGITSF